MALFIAVLPTRGDGAAELPLDQIVARHHATLQRLKRCTVVTNENVMMTFADGSPEKLLSTRKCDIRIDGPRSNLLVYEVNYPSPSEGYVNEFNYVCDEQALEIFYPHEASVRTAVPRGVSGRLSPEKEDEHFVQIAMGNAGVAFGKAPFTGSIALTDLISLGKNEVVVSDDIGRRIEGTAPDGSFFKIWFDPDASFTVKKLTIEQSGQAVSENRFQYNRRVLKARYGFSEKAVVKSAIVELHKVEVMPWKDTHLITSLEVTKTITAEDGSKAIERTAHTLTNWNLEPDFSDPASFQPRLPVPEGVRVLVSDTPSLEYSYQQGKIDLAINHRTVGLLEKVELPRHSAPPSLQWIWGLVAAVLGIAWWRMRVVDI